MYTLITILSLSLTWAASAHANVLQSKSQQLKHLKQQIHQTRQHMINAQGKRDALEDELKQNELQINRFSNQIDHTRQVSQSLHQQIKQLKQQHHDATQRLKHQQRQLSKHLHMAYLMGQQHPLKSLINAENPIKLQTLHVYHRAINQARLNIIQDLDHTISDISNVQTQLKQRRQQLTRAEQQQKTNLANLQRAKNDNRRVLKKLSHRIKTQQNSLKHLDRNKHELEQLIKALRSMPKNLDIHTPFKILRHKLPWPTKGSIASSTSDKRPGLFIKAPDGQRIQSIFPGRVIFADWLRAYGLLIIVEHNSGYMSLYAHNESLYKKVGDKVKAGEIIAKVGHSGGNSESGLYFEIRHDGKPVDPFRWCRKQHH